VIKEGREEEEERKKMKRDEKRREHGARPSTESFSVAV
jgi:hypothetical protein